MYCWRYHSLPALASALASALPGASITPGEINIDVTQANVLAHMPERAEPIRCLIYRLCTLCENTSWADEARSYNEPVTSWLGIEAAFHETGHLDSQAKLDI